MCKPQKPVINHFYGKTSLIMKKDVSCCQGAYEFDLNELDNSFRFTAGIDSDDLEGNDSQRYSSFELQQPLFNHADEYPDSQSFILPRYINPCDIMNSLKPMHQITFNQMERALGVQDFLHSPNVYEWTRQICVKIHQINQRITIGAESKDWAEYTRQCHMIHMRKQLPQLNKVPSDCHYSLATDYIFKLQTVMLQNHKDKLWPDELAPCVSSLPNPSEMGQNKIRYVGGMCIAKRRWHYSQVLQGNLWNENKQGTVDECKSKLKLLHAMEGTIEDSLLPSTMEYTESKQNHRHSLTHIIDDVYRFFQYLDEVQSQIVTTINLLTSKKETFNVVLEEINSNADIEEKFLVVTSGVDVDRDFARDLCREIVFIYLSVVFNQFVKDVKDDMKVTKRAAHRKDLKEKHEKAASRIVNEITLLEIVNDTSAGKKISFIQLKALIMGNKKYFMCKTWTKDDMFQLYELSNISYKKSYKKEIINDLLVSCLSVSDQFAKPDYVASNDSKKNAKRKASSVQSSPKRRETRIYVVTFTKNMLKMRSG